MNIIHVDVAIIGKGTWAGLEGITCPVESKGFISWSDDSKVMISGKELIRLGGDPKIIDDTNYAFAINLSVSILEVTKVLKVY